ncbi:MAG: flippase [Candidatus Electrothrix sp. AX1]|nr:flippase [Candidatus Electrothrix sp. AX1]
MLFDQITLAITYIVVYRYQKLKFPPFSQFDVAVAKALIRDSWPLIFSGIVVMIYMRIDQVMIKEILSEDDVGIYSAAVKLSEVWYFIPIAIANSLFPAIISARKISEEVYYKRLQQFYDLMVLISVSIALPMIFLSSWLISFLYGAAYAGAASVLSIHIWAGVFVFLGIACGKHLLAENLQRITIYRTGAGVITNVLLNTLLIPKYNITGAACATLVSQIVASYLGNILSKKTILPFLMQSKALFGLNIIKRGLKSIS